MTGEETESGYSGMWLFEPEEQRTTNWQGTELLLCQRTPEIHLIDQAQIVRWTEVIEPSSVRIGDDRVLHLNSK